MRTLARALFLIGGTAVAAAAIAQSSWPSKPIRVLVGYTPGVSPDLVARVTAAEIGRRLGQAMVVENRPGAGGHIANTAVSRAEPDGYTLLLAGQPLNSHPLFTKTDPLVVGKDLSPLGDVSRTPLVLLVRSDLGIRTFQDLVAYAKKNPDKLNYAAISQQNDLFMELVKAKVGMSWTDVPFRGGLPIPSFLRGDVDFYLGTLGGIGSHVQAGKITPLLFFGRHPDYPNAPLASELGVLNVPLRSQLGYFGPPNLPREVVQKFSQAAGAVSRMPEVVEQLRKLAVESAYLEPDEQLKDYEAKIAALSEAVRMTNFKPQ